MRWPAWHHYIGALQGHYASSLSRRQFFTIVGLFWAYVTLSNVLWAYGMRTGIAKVTNLPLFSPWDARVLQHVFLLPLILVSYWASMRIQWRPLLVALPLQIILALSFAALAYPALILGEYSVADHAWHAQLAAPWKQSVLGPDGDVALARELRELPADLWLRAHARHRSCPVFAISQVRAVARGTRARVERRAPGGAAHAALAAHAVQLAAHHPRTHRMGSEGRAVHGGAARGPAAPPVECRRARFLAPRRGTAIRAAVPGAAAEALLGPLERDPAAAAGHRRCVGAQLDPAAIGRECRGARPRGPPGTGDHSSHGGPPRRLARPACHQHHRAGQARGSSGHRRE